MPSSPVMKLSSGSPSAAGMTSPSRADPAAMPPAPPAGRGQDGAVGRQRRLQRGGPRGGPQGALHGRLLPQSRLSPTNGTPVVPAQQNPSTPTGSLRSPSANSRHSTLAWRSAATAVSSAKHSQRADCARSSGPPPTSNLLCCAACGARACRAAGVAALAQQHRKKEEAFALKGLLALRHVSLSPCPPCQQ